MGRDREARNAADRARYQRVKDDPAYRAKAKAFRDDAGAKARQRERMAAWYADHRPEELVKARQRYRASGPEAIMAAGLRSAARYRDDPDTRAKAKTRKAARRANGSAVEYEREYRERNRGRVRDRNRIYARAYRAAHPDRQHAAIAARRAQLTGAAVVEKVVRSVVFERDGWTCQLCGEPVDRALRHPDPMSKSIDHRVSLKRGGEHSYANCQLAHLVCNIRKGHR